VDWVSGLRVWRAWGLSFITGGAACVQDGGFMVWFGADYFCGDM
jgi:hypothetical protein